MGKDVNASMTYYDKEVPEMRIYVSIFGSSIAGTLTGGRLESW